MGCIIDSCILINAERNKDTLLKRFSSMKKESFYISVITASELLYGVEVASDFNIKNKRKAFVEDILLKFPIIQTNLSVARMHAKISSELKQNGNIIGTHDIWIGATCIAHGYSLLTDNIKDFKRIPGLKLI